MANRISGITIEIGGDTTKLQSSLKGVDSQLKSTQSALKDVNKLLKMDPGNVDLLRQKQKDLKDAIDQTKTRLEQLRSAQSQFAEGSKEYDAIQREIIATEQNLKSLTDEYSHLRSVAGPVIQDLGAKMKDLGGKMTDVGTSLTKNVTAPIAAVAGASVAAWKDVDSAMDIVITKTGASGEALARLQSTVETLATTMPTTFEDAATAVGEVNTRFGLTGQELEDVSRAFLQFAEINGTDVNGSIDGVQKAMAAFQVEASDAGAVLDVLNVVGQNTGVSLDSLTAQLSANAPVMREMGLNMDQAAVFLGNLEVNGIESTAVLTGLKKALQNATKDGKSMDQALSDLQISLANASSDTAALQIATELFGAKSAPALVQAIQDGRLSFDELTASVEGYGGSVASTFEATQDPLDQLQTNMNGLKLVGADLVNTAAPAISSAMTGLSNVIQSLTAWWGGLSEEEQQNILKIAGVVAAIGPAIAIGGKLVSSIGGIVSALGTVIGVLGGPLTLAIGAAIAAGVLIWKNWDTIKEKATQVGAWVSDKWNAMKTNVSNAVNDMKAKASAAWDNIKSVAAEKTESMKGMLQGKWDAIKGAYETHGGGLKGAAAAAIEGVKQYFTLGFDTINTLTGGKLDGIKSKFQGIMGSIKSIVQSGLDAVKKAFNFSWKLPDLKLPHLSVSGGVAPYGIGGKGSLPHFNISWYKRAYDNPIMFQNPTVVPTTAGLKGFGDGAGAEIVMGLNKLRELVGSSGDTVINVYATPGMDVNALADAVQARLVALQRQREAAYA